MDGLERDYEDFFDTTTAAMTLDSEPETIEPVPSPKDDSIGPHSLHQEPELTPLSTSDSIGPQTFSEQPTTPTPLSKEDSIDPQTFQEQFEPTPPLKEDSISPQTPQERSKPAFIAEPNSVPEPSSIKSSPSSESGPSIAESISVAESSSPAAGQSCIVGPTVPDDLGEVEIEEFVSHRVVIDESRVDIKVKWVTGVTTWESEYLLQEQVPTLVYEYWDKVGGRDAVTGLRDYHVFNIIKRQATPKKNCKYQVHWVGFRPSDSSWEDVSKLMRIAPGHMDKFHEKQRVAAANAVGRRTKRGIAQRSRNTKKKAKLDEE